MVRTEVRETRNDLIPYITKGMRGFCKKISVKGFRTPTRSQGFVQLVR